MKERDSKYHRLDGEFRLFKWETWHTFLAQGLVGTGSKLPQKVMDFLLHNYPDELLKSF